MAYPDTDIFLMAYDMTRKNTLERIVVHDLNDMASYKCPDPEEAGYDYDSRQRCSHRIGCQCGNDEDDDDFDGWLSEITAQCESREDFQIILVGCKADLWEELNASGTPEQKAELTTWQQGYDVPAASHLRFDAYT